MRLVVTDSSGNPSGDPNGDPFHNKAPATLISGIGNQATAWLGACLKWINAATVAQITSERKEM